jgi:broad specificity phosphatase PhoE
VIILARHGETDANRAGLLLGRADPPLNERGRQQAAALAAALHRDPRPALFTSPLRRARETADMIGAALGVDVTVEPRLIELDYGEWDERRIADLPPDVVARWRTDPRYAPPGGESLVDLHARVAPLTAEALRWSHDQVVLLVSHVSPIKAILLGALDLPDEYAWRLRLDVASLCRLTDGVPGAVLMSFNETGHLR